MAQGGVAVSIVENSMSITPSMTVLRINTCR